MTDRETRLINSPIEKINFAGYSFHIKRDDLLNPLFSGNKARKFAHYLAKNTAQSKLSNITHLVSYGSIQANSLYSLAALAKLKAWTFDFYVKRIPAWLKGSTLGNYGQAVALGANIIELNQETINASPKKNLDSAMHHIAQSLPCSHLFIPEGGRSHFAQIGINTLAKEIADYCKIQLLFNNSKKIYIMLPSGTGTTALFLQQWFCQNNYPIAVLTCACVGSSDYLKQQFASLNSNQSQWPIILPSSPSFHFGKLNINHYTLWQTLLTETGIEFELLYDPVGWQSLLDYLTNNHIDASKATLFYLHQGGLIGNQTMLPRYKRKYPTLK